MHGTNIAVLIDVDHGAVDTVAAAVGGAFHDAKIDSDTALFCGICDALQIAIPD